MKKYPSPCFLLEEEKLRANLNLIRDVQQKAGIEIILAFKAFAMWSTFPIVREYIKGATASSLHEAMLCNEEMKAKAHTYSPAYLPNEFDRMARLSSHLTFNSLGQFHLFKDKLTQHPEVKFGLRINPEYSDVETDLYNPSAPDSRLGELAEALQEGLPEEITGLHFHVLCESDVTALEKVLEKVEEKFGHLLPKISWINMGGGHLMTRQDYDSESLVRLLRNFKNKHKVDIILEPGSAFAWQTGFLTATVLDIVERRGVKTAVLNVSFTCHMPDCLEMPYRPEVRGARTPKPGETAYRLGGVSCLAGDYLGDYYFENGIAIGDQIILEDMIHYTMVKTTFFNGVKHPDIGIIRLDQSIDIIRSFGYEDFKERLG